MSGSADFIILRVIRVKGLGYRDFNLKHNQFVARCLRMQQLLATKVQNVHRPMRSYRKLSIRQESNLINDQKIVLAVLGVCQAA